MKYFFYLIIILNIIPVKSNEYFKFIIKGTINEKFNNETITLYLVEDDTLHSLAMDTIKDGIFKFEGNENLKNVAKLILNNPTQNYSCEVFLEKGNINVVLDSISNISGTPLNDLYYTYLSDSYSIDAIAEQEYMISIKDKENPQTLRFDSLMSERTKFKRNFQIDNINNIVGKYVYVKEIGSFYDPLFWETYNLLPSDVKSNKRVLNYCIIRKEMDENQKKISKEIGHAFKNIQLYTTANREVSLSDYINNSNYLYIDIWASWCNPCMKGFPELKLIFEKYRNKGLNILLISIDKKMNYWLNAINKHELKFDNLIDPTGGEKISQVFEYTVIPHGILLDSKGIIIANDLNNISLKKKLIEIFGE